MALKISESMVLSMLIELLLANLLRRVLLDIQLTNTPTVRLRLDKVMEKMIKTKIEEDKGKKVEDRLKNEETMMTMKIDKETKEDKVAKGEAAIQEMMMRWLTKTELKT